MTASDPTVRPRETGLRAGARTFLGAVSGVALFAMMMLTVVDVIGRKFFQRSLVGGVELTELAMLAMIFGALPLASLMAEHVVFDMLDAWLPARVKALQHRISNGLAALLMATAGWFLFERAARTLEMGDQTAQLAIPIAPFHYGAAALVVATALMHLLLALDRPQPA